MNIYIEKNCSFSLNLMIKIGKKYFYGQKKGMKSADGTNVHLMYGLADVCTYVSSVDS